MIYNKDLFDQAGVDYPTNDWTWEDELEAAKKNSCNGGKLFRCLSTHSNMGVLQNSCSKWWKYDECRATELPLIHQKCGSIRDDD